MPSSNSPKQPTDHKPKKTTKKRPQQQQDRSQPIPVPEDPNSKYAPNSWLSGGNGELMDLEVPSGQLCLVRRPGVEGLMVAGVLRNIDSLSAIVGSEHLEKGGKQVKPETLLNDPDALATIMHTVDRVVCHCVVKPSVHMAPNDVTLRKPGVVYADMVDIMDKMHIFNYVVGGSGDLESFREGLGEHVGGLEALEGVLQPTE